MLGALKALFETEAQTETDREHQVRLAAAALLTETARADFTQSAAEETTLKHLLCRALELTDVEVTELMNDAADIYSLGMIAAEMLSPSGLPNDRDEAKAEAIMMLSSYPSVLSKLISNCIGENLAARALGREEMAFQWDAVRAVVTRYDGAQQAELAGLMQAYLGRTLSPHRQDFTALIGQAGEQVQGIYEADYRDFNRETYARGRETFDATYAAFKALLVGAWHRDATAAQAAAE